MGIERRQVVIGGAILTACLGVSITGHVTSVEPIEEPDEGLVFEMPELGTEPLPVRSVVIEHDDAPRVARRRDVLRLGCDVVGETLLRTAVEGPFEARMSKVDLISVPGNEATNLAELREGKLDAILLTRPLTHREWRKGLRALEVVRVAFAAVASPSFPVFDLERSQLGDLVSGRTREWTRMGATPLPVSVELVSRRDPLLEMAMLRFFPGKRPSTNASRHADLDRLLALVAATPGSLSFVPLARVDGSLVRVLTIGGIYPTFETIRSGSYPLVFSLVYVTRAEAKRLALALRGFLRSGGARTELRSFGLPMN